MLNNYFKTTRSVLICLATLGLSSAYCNAQSNVITSGANGNGAAGSVSFTIGQLDYINANSTTGDINQGVQQPFEIYKVTGIDDMQLAGLDIQISPNPSFGAMTLLINGASFEQKKLSYSIQSINGDRLAYQSITNRQTPIKLEHLAAATYFLTIYAEQVKIATYKIVKNN
jgi:hypothetical protein